MAGTKTVSIGALYGLTPVGTDAILNTIKSNYDDTKSAPFVYYDYSMDVLTFSVDRQDTSTATSVAASLKLFIEEERRKVQVIDPAIQPLEGALLRTEIDFSNTQHELPGLVDVGDFDDTSNDPLQPLQHVTTYWYPTDGSIKILTTTVAEELASITGCSIYPEDSDKRIRLVGGDFDAALRKLQNLEPLLALQYQQVRFDTIKTDANVLLLTTEEPHPIMEFERVDNPDHPAFRRIITEHGSAVLRAKALCEIRLPGLPPPDSIPSNLSLEKVSHTQNSARTSIWDHFTYPSIGDVRNREPRITSEDADKKVASPPSSKLGTNEYIEPSKAARVAAWSGQIDDRVDPNEIPPEEPDQSSRRRRKVLVDSDSDEDTPEPPKAPKAEAARPQLLEPKNAGQSTKGAAQLLPEVLVPLRPRQPSNVASTLVSDLLKDEESVASLKPATTTPQAMQSRAGDPTILPPTRSLKKDSETDASELMKPTSASNAKLISIAGSVAASDLASNDHMLGANKSIETDKLLSMLHSQQERQTQYPPNGAPDHLDPLSQHKPSSATTSLQQNSLRPPPGLKLPSERPVFDFPDEAFGADANASSLFPRTSPVTRDSVQSVDKGMFPINTASNTASSGRQDGTTATLTTVSPHESPSRSFDPNAHGARNRASRGASQTQHISRATDSSQPVSAAYSQIEGVQSKRFGRRHRGRGSSAVNVATNARPSRSDLIDVNTEETGTNRNVAPPHGFDPQPALSPVRAEAPQPAHLLDERSETQGSRLGPVLQPTSPLTHQPVKSLTSTGPADLQRDHQTGRAPSQISVRSGRGSQGDNSESKSPLSGSRITPELEESASYVNTQVYKGPNINALEGSSLAKLKAERARRAERAIQLESEKKSRKRGQNPEKPSTHSTMRQKAPNPGKKGVQKQETKAEKKKRKDEAMIAAYGEPPVATNKPPKPQEELPMSKKKQTLLPTTFKMAAGNSQEADLPNRQVAANNLITALTPIFEASRAFCGTISFEVRLGQLLLSHDLKIRDKSFTRKKWQKTLGPEAKMPILTAFTPALTTNGADIDRALEITSIRDDRLWDVSSPGPVSVSYEFVCQSKHGQQFLLVLDQKGSYVIRESGPIVLGMVGLHCPAQIWDACAVVQGVADWSASDEVRTAIKAFVNTIYVLPSRHELALLFRQPDDNEITIKNALLKRVSSHNCLQPEFDQCQLQVTEVKNLYTKVHPKDKKLWQAYEMSHQDMMKDGTVHFQLSIIDKSINQVLSRNEDLELGELARPPAGKALLQVDRIKQIVDLTSHMLTRMDWMGSGNFGTLARAAEAEYVQRLRQQQSLPPMARTRTQVMAASRINPASRVGAGAASVSGPATGSVVGESVRQLPGTRFNTLAAIYEDEYGYYRRGYGGARVPLGAAELALGMISEEPVLPDDSASQIERGTGPARRKGGFHGDKGPGFW